MDKRNAGKLAAMAALGTAGLLGAAAGAKYLGRFVIDKVHDRFLKIITTDLYDETLGGGLLHDANSSPGGIETELWQNGPSW